MATNIENSDMRASFSCRSRYNVIKSIVVYVNGCYPNTTAKLFRVG
ncbi:MAG: hypothetical protein AAB490_01170 [Patescibacteria group bacterium]